MYYLKNGSLTGKSPEHESATQGLSIEAYRETARTMEADDYTTGYKGSMGVWKV